MGRERCSLRTVSVQQLEIEENKNGKKKRW